MMIFDFITQDEMDDLPDDDPQSAFTRFVEIARRRSAENTGGFDESEASWQKLNEAQHGFMNVVIAAAKRFEIEPLATLSVPRATKFDSDVYREFRSDLDHYLTQLLLSNSARAKRDSILVPPNLKTTIRTYVFHLRELIENDNDLGETKRQTLLRHLTDFEKALEKKRLNLLSVTVLAVTILGAPGALWGSADAANKLLTNILRIVGEAKIADDETRQLPSAAPPLAITGPRPDESSHGEFGSRSPRKDMDDDVPF
jgi:hypothetical protein